MTNALLTCTTCNDIFRSRNDLNNHVRRNHQSSVKVKFQNGTVTEVQKGEDGRFNCKCGKSFKLPWSLQRHAKGCRGELAEPGQAEGEVPLQDDASESMDFDEEVVDEIPADCYGALFSREIS